MKKNIWAVVVGYTRKEANIDDNVEHIYCSNTKEENISEFDEINKDDYIFLIYKKEIHCIGIIVSKNKVSISNNNNSEIKGYKKPVKWFLKYQKEINSINDDDTNKRYKLPDFDLKEEIPTDILSSIYIKKCKLKQEIKEYLQSICEKCENTSLEDILDTLYVEKMIVGKDNCKKGQ